MQSRLTWGTHQVGIHSYSRDPRQPVAGKDKRPGIALFARHMSVDEDVLELSRAATTERAHGQAGAAKPESDI
jgi:hypothetical protein